MPISLQLTSVQLRVPDLARSVVFYTEQLGFAPVRQSADTAELAPAAGAPAILTLTGDRHAPAAPRDAAGLFHAALLLPSRADLGAWLRHAAKRRAEFDGFSDHGVSEAIYLSDPDGNGLEFYADRPRAAWPFAASGELAMTTAALDGPALVADGGPAKPFPLAGARWGHLHLRAIDLPRSEAFYREALGVEITQRSYPGARFMAADGYHHHIAINTWSASRRPQPDGTLGLASATFARTHLAAAKKITAPEGYVLALEPLR